jgi:hypothetical protein
MGWIGWSLVVVVLVLPLALLCYSAVATAIEIDRKGQPYLDSFFAAIAFISGYSKPRREAVQQIKTERKDAKIAPEE